MENRLVQLVINSRNCLYEGEELCYTGTEVIQSSQDLFQNLQILYPRLIFMQRFLTQQLKCLESVLILADDKLNDLKTFVDIKTTDMDKILTNLDLLKEKLKGTSIYDNTDLYADETHNSINIPIQNDTEHKNLYDYIDDKKAQELIDNVEVELVQLKEFQAKLEGLIFGLKEGLKQLKITLYEEHASISLTESAIKYVQDKSTFQAKQAGIMAQALLSLSNHYEAVTDSIRGIEDNVISSHTLDEAKLFVLERDTEELQSIKEELEQSLQIIESIHEDAIVRQQLYHVVYQEKVQFFKQLNMYNISIGELCQILKVIDAEITQQPVIESYLEDLWGLGTSYEDFIDAYNSVLLELDRRRKIEEQHSLMISQLNQKLTSMYDDEKRLRNSFLYKIANFLPGELSLSLNVLPKAYSIVQLEPITNKTDESPSVDSIKSQEKTKEPKVADELQGSEKDETVQAVGLNLELRRPSNSSLDANSNDANFQSANSSNHSSYHEGSPTQ